MVTVFAGPIKQIPENACCVGTRRIKLRSLHGDGLCFLLTSLSRRLCQGPQSVEVIDDATSLFGRHDSHTAWRFAAWRSRRLTEALAWAFGLSHSDSVSNLVRRVDRSLGEPSKLRHDIEMIERILERVKTENRA